MRILLIQILFMFFSGISFAAGISETQVTNFLVDWFHAQNTGSFSRYAAMYSKNFTGIRRSGNTTRTYDYTSWLKDRKRMFKKKILVKSDRPWVIKVSDTFASVKFEQTWESGTYKDIGDKLINLALENGKLKIIREEMLSSKIIPNKDIEDSEVSTVTKGTTPDGAGMYTSVKYEDCWEPKGYFAKQFDFDEYTKECPGLKGWRLFRVADEERSWFEIAKGQRLWSTQYEVNGSGKYGFGQMQDLGDLARVEWRLKPDGTPLALIFQVQAMDPKSTNYRLKILYRFYVIGLSKGVPQLCGIAKTKDEARKMTINQVGCTDLQERKFSQ